jgi:hypothetical protein
MRSMTGTSAWEAAAQALLSKIPKKYRRDYEKFRRRTI